MCKALAEGKGTVANGFNGGREFDVFQAFLIVESVGTNACDGIFVIQSHFWNTEFVGVFSTLRMHEICCSVLFHQENIPFGEQIGRRSGFGELFPHVWEIVSPITADVFVETTVLQYQNGMIVLGRVEGLGSYGDGVVHVCHHFFQFFALGESQLLDVGEGCRQMDTLYRSAVLESLLTNNHEIFGQQLRPIRS